MLVGRVLVRHLDADFWNDKVDNAIYTVWRVLPALPIHIIHAYKKPFFCEEFITFWCTQRAFTLHARNKKYRKWVFATTDQSGWHPGDHSTIQSFLLRMIPKRTLYKMPSKKSRKGSATWHATNEKSSCCPSASALRVCFSCCSPTCTMQGITAHRRARYVCFCTEEDLWSNMVLVLLIPPLLAQGWGFLLLAGLTGIPGFYGLVIVYGAWQRWPGYSYTDLPLY